MIDLVNQYITDNYSVIDNGLYEKYDGRLILPNVLENRISIIFGYDNDLTYIMVYNWLYMNGMRNIKAYWDVFNENSMNQLIRKL